MSGRVQSVERAAAIMHLLAVEGVPVSLGQICGAVGLAKGTAHGLLRTLHDVGFVEQDPETGLYRVGAGLLQLGTSRLDRNELRSRALNWTDALAARTGEAALVAVYDAGGALVVHHVFRPDASEQRLETGTRLPLHASAVGKVLLAHDPGAARSIAGGELESYTFRTVTDRGQLMRQLADARDHGWAAAVDECEPGVASIAAPIRDRGGYVIAAVGVKGRPDAVCDHQLRPSGALVHEVMSVGRSISREFGHGRAL